MRRGQRGWQAASVALGVDWLCLPLDPLGPFGAPMLPFSLVHLSPSSLWPTHPGPSNPAGTRQHTTLRPWPCPPTTCSLYAYVGTQRGWHLTVSALGAGTCPPGFAYLARVLASPCSVLLAPAAFFQDGSTRQLAMPGGGRACIGVMHGINPPSTAFFLAAGLQ